jgi:hypothetical protein
VKAGELKKANEDLEIARNTAEEKARAEAEAAEKLRIANTELEEQKKITEEAKQKAEGERDAAVEAQLRAKREADENAKVAYALLAQTTFSADGKRVLTLTKNDVVRVWDTTSNALIKELPTNPYSFPALSSDGKLIATSNRAGDVQVVDVVTGTVTDFPNVLANPARLEFSPDTSQLAIIGDGDELKVINLKTKKTTVSLSGKGAQIIDVAFSADGKSIAITDISQENRLVKISSNQQIETQLNTGKCRPFELNVLDISPSYELKASLMVRRKCSANGESAWGLTMDVFSRQGKGEYSQLAHVSYENQDDTGALTLETLASEGLNDEQERRIGERIKVFGNEAAEITDVDEVVRTSKLSKLSMTLFWNIVVDLGLPRPQRADETN